MVDAPDVQEAVTRVRDAISVKRVFGEPYEKGGVTIIPAARIWGGGGGGLQNGPDRDAPDQGRSFGSGFGMLGRPAGVVVIRGDRVRWQPAVDPNLIVAAVLIVAVVVLRGARRRRRARWARRHAVTSGSEESRRAPAEPAVDGEPE